MNTEAEKRKADRDADRAAAGGHGAWSASPESSTRIPARAENERKFSQSPTSSKKRIMSDSQSEPVAIREELKVKLPLHLPPTSPMCSPKTKARRSPPAIRIPLRPRLPRFTLRQLRFINRIDLDSRSRILYDLCSRQPRTPRRAVIRFCMNSQRVSPLHHPSTSPSADHSPIDLQREGTFFVAIRNAELEAEAAKGLLDLGERY